MDCEMTEPIAIVTGHESMVEAFRLAKERLGLSNAFCDDIGGLTAGHTDKILGPTRVKNLGPMTLDLFCEMFAVQFIMVTNIEAAKRMEPRWEGRESTHVRIEPVRVSKAIIERAKPHVLREHLKKANAARNAQLSCEQRTEIARKAGRARQRKARKQRRNARTLPKTETPAPIHP
jgi:hypothetical protein